ncbi:hypothetical protein RJ639_023395 [Escallonia herrerae]|uniref:BHLH domain-containing protein n=1 Tax=Escallonia herrerae TaxID=1293975 RepID=A0AA88V155_9ASTE|nr:hypothetical protein RJ639_023395 [Escallonia herrerae]
MALAKDRAPHDSNSSLGQSHTYLANLFGESSIQVSDLPSPGFYGFEPEEVPSVINFKNEYDSLMHAGGSLLSFEQNSYPKIVYNQGESQLNNPRATTNERLLDNFGCIQSASSKENPYGGVSFGWLGHEATAASSDSLDHENGMQEACFLKRPNTGEGMQPFKRQCTNSTKNPKPKSTQSKDPQSVAAKNRRERISERLKVLQDLVPNGTKVDLVTMLEKAINYVKFLQLQVKVLATDELWPVQGGKAPELSQVKDAIDAILASQRDTSSSSK